MVLLKPGILSSRGLVGGREGGGRGQGAKDQVAPVPGPPGPGVGASSACWASGGQGKLGGWGLGPDVRTVEGIGREGGHSGGFLFHLCSLPVHPAICFQTSPAKSLFLWR